MSITLFFCSKSLISLYWRGLVLGEKKCSSSSLALMLEYYIDSSDDLDNVMSEINIYGEYFHDNDRCI